MQNIKTGRLKKQQVSSNDKKKKKSKAGNKADKKRVEQIQRTRGEYKMSTNTRRKHKSDKTDEVTNKQGKRNLKTQGLRNK